MTSTGCIEAGCEGVAHARGRCRPHYRTWLSARPVDLDAPVETRPVAVLYRCLTCARLHRADVDLLGRVHVPPCDGRALVLVLTIGEESRPPRSRPGERAS